MNMLIAEQVVNQQTQEAIAATLLACRQTGAL